MNNPNDIGPYIQTHINAILQKYDKDRNSWIDKEELRLILADNLGVQPNAITQDQL